MSAEVDALLERLVAQFESPYDFLRELVQNAMDAGSDRVEVTLESHPLSEAPGEVIFELTILDTGAGMDEAIIDQELTRLFSSGKSGDRTMAGGFGIGFVSVFAWEPEAILVHTGRAGESWELVFHGDRSFEKVALEDPLEGTTIILFRRGRASEREAIADAIRDSLWRWCRFCPLEVSFEDLDGDEPAELIQDAPEPTELGLGAGLTRAEVRGESTLRVSFAVPANAVFLRRGLILAEGGPRQLLAGVADALGSTSEHLQIWADSPLLRTSLARDKVLDDGGRAQVEERLLGLVAELREDLLARLEALAAIGQDARPADEADDLRADPDWTHERHAIYGALHAHLELEYAHLERKPRTRAILRDLAHGRAVSLDAAVERMGARPLLVATPPSILREGGAAPKEGERPIVEGLERLLRDLGPTSFPVLAGDLGEDRAWLTALTKLAEVELLPVERAVARVAPREGEAAGLCGLVESLVRGLGFDQATIRVGEFVDVLGRPERSPVFGPEVFGAASPLAFHGGRTIPAASLRRRTVWLNAHNTLVEAAVARFVERPLVAGLALTCGLLGHLDDPPEVGDVAKLAEALDRDSQGARP
ncbi:Chaperone protein HtpG [Enhygromyxa salina]|uniref:Chaperone protein HtpG n=1 Tax=Enhygromyxa salina TaxID=215803 RepID=A0A2S9XRI0_9BACT|nr:ATP-binding protein [Enhygromyxa salina]PRP95473.1 Chaperone protein HtpG [Enhygromyxa salina]